MTDLREAIFQYVKKNGPVRFMQIDAAVGPKGNNGFRQTDREIQKLRKQGWIKQEGFGNWVAVKAMTAQEGKS